MTAPSRPAARWYGGKWRLAPKILPHFPPHRTYVEPFCGAASMLLRKERTYSEVINDLDDDVVTLFRVLRDPVTAGMLADQVTLTPFSRSEFRDCYGPTDDPVEQSRRLLVRSFMGFGANAHASSRGGHRSTGFRASSSRSGTTPSRDWMNFPPALVAISERLRGVVIENRPAMECMAQHDRPDTLHYLDPPYMPETRSPGNHYDQKYRMYRHELTEEDHAALLVFARNLQGTAAISGYATALYDDMLVGWTRIEIDAYADGARPRTEILWLNPALVEARALSAGPLLRGFG